YLINLVQAVLEALMFYHPAVWWLSGRLRNEREYCCDDIAVAVGGGRLCYAKALSALDDCAAAPLQPILASTGGSLMNRIRRLVGLPLLPARATPTWIASAAVSVAFLAVAAAVGRAPVAADAPVEEGLRLKQESPERLKGAALEEVDLVEV